jgi:hemolysin activation/secretion protein
VIFPLQPGAPGGDRNGPRFQVHAFNFVGNTAFTEERLKRVVDRFLDLELNLYDLNVAADAVTEFYHDQGYTLARAVIPAQRVQDGQVQIAIVEGRIGKVLFSGAKRYDEGFLNARVPSLAPGTLVTTDRLERDLLLLNDLPGLKARSTLLPGQTFGLSDVQIKLEEKPITGDVALDNYGREETGRTRLDAGLQLNNPLRLGDQLTLRGVYTNEHLQRYKSVGYSLPLGNSGLRLAATYSDVHYDVAGAFAALGLGGWARTTELTLQDPEIRTRAHTRMVNLGVRDTDLVQSVFGNELTHVHFSALTAGWADNRINEDASVTNWTFTVATNFGRNNSGLSQTAEAGRFEGDLNHQQPLGNGWDVYLRANGVYSPQRLPDSEKFSLGGPGSVRAYIASELRGDSGYQGTLEFRRASAIAARPVIYSLFWDLGSVIYKAPGFSDNKQSIAGYGAGVQLFAAHDVQMKAEYAIPANNYHASDGKSDRLWLTVSASF